MEESDIVIVRFESGPLGGQVKAMRLPLYPSYTCPVYRRGIAWTVSNVDEFTPPVIDQDRYSLRCVYDAHTGRVVDRYYVLSDVPQWWLDDQMRIESLRAVQNERLYQNSNTDT